MRVPLAWLQKHTALNLDDIGLERVAHGLTMAGLEVEEIVDSAVGPVLVTKVTPNRGDWLSMKGVARELDAIFPDESRTEPESGDGALYAGARPDSLPNLPIRIDVIDWCSRYAAKIVELSAPVGPAPQEIQDLLTAAGVRPINAVVDYTNYVMLGEGQPLHAFDLDTLTGPEIIVRAARSGERIVALDGVERQLDPSMMVVADAEKPVAIAGIMGGRDTEITASTRRVLIESAHFDPMVVRAASKKLGLSTDASYRFERFVSPNLVQFALGSAASLIGKLPGATELPQLTDSFPVTPPHHTIQVRDTRAAAILGVPEESVRSVDTSLQKLGFRWKRNEQSGEREFAAPAWRNDILKEIDVIEEIGRMIGYHTLPETLPPARSTSGGGRDSPEGLLTGKTRSILMGQGLTEIYSHTLSAPSAFDDPAATENRVKIRSALSAELSGLRQSLIPGLLETLARNARLRNTGVDLFEVGSVFWTGAGEGYSQGLRAAVAVQGDYMRARGIAENLFAAMGIAFPDVTAHIQPGMHPSRTALLTLNEQEVGYIAEADPDMIAEHLDLPAAFGRVGCFEINLDRVAELTPGPASYFPLPKYPEVTRDLAMVFDADAPYGTIERVAKLAAGEYLESVSLASIYTGDRIEAGRKSVALRFTLRAQDRTLTDADADDALLSAQNALIENLGASLR